MEKNRYFRKRRKPGRELKQVISQELEETTADGRETAVPLKAQSLILE